ncbi:MAG TPA: toll/interleukin-1 receptor domain-containing protein [Thermoanaerobaculia bacterium]
MRVFVSYSHLDRGFVRLFSAALNKRGIDVWLDEHEFDIGEKLADRIDWAINNCGYVVIVISDSSIASAWVRYELELVLVREQTEQRTCLIPVLLQGERIPASIQGRIIADFRTQHGLEVGFEKIVRTIGRSRIGADYPGYIQRKGDGTIENPYSHEDLWDSGPDRSMRTCNVCKTEYARLYFSDGGGVICAHCGSYLSW